jgi:hypothetical protein
MFILWLSQHVCIYVLISIFHATPSCLFTRQQTYNSTLQMHDPRSSFAASSGTLLTDTDRAGSSRKRNSVTHTATTAWESVSIKKGNSCEIKCVRSEILTTTALKITILRAAMKAINLTTFRKYLQHPPSGQNHHSYILKMKMADSSKTAVNFYKATRRHIPQDSTLCNTVCLPTSFVATRAALLSCYTVTMWQTLLTASGH